MLPHMTAAHDDKFIILMIIFIILMIMCMMNNDNVYDDEKVFTRFAHVISNVDTYRDCTHFFGYSNHMGTMMVINKFVTMMMFMMIMVLLIILIMTCSQMYDVYGFCQA